MLVERALTHVSGRVVMVGDRRFDIDLFDAELNPVTGNVTLEESTNWDETEDKTIEITQVDPMPMELLGIEVVLSSNE